jgi:hypothetical protein
MSGFGLLGRLTRSLYLFGKPRAIPRATTQAPNCSPSRVPRA